MTESAEPVLNASAPLRILTFTTLYPNETQPTHGIFVENRLRHLVATGRIRARVVAPVPWFPSKAPHFGRYAEYAHVPASEIRSGIEIAHPRYFVPPRVGMLVTPATLYAGSRGLLRRWRAGFDLIDAHYFYPDGVAAVLLGLALKKPVVVTARGTDVNLIPRHAVPRKMICSAAEHCAGIIAVSSALKEAMIAIGIAAERITVLRNGVDPQMFRPVDRVSARHSLAVDGKVLLSVGHLIDRKGHDLIIKALAGLHDCTLIIVGEGPERRRLEALASSFGVNHRVRFLGSVPHDQLAAIYSAADALVLASSREGWANVLLESMACGTPVAATSIWGTPEIVSDPAAGILIPERTPACIAGTVVRLLSNPPSRDETRAFAERFSWDETSAGQLRLFEQVLSAKSRT